jgi:hypothetical protein
MLNELLILDIIQLLIDYRIPKQDSNPALAKFTFSSYAIYISVKIQIKNNNFSFFLRSI